MKKERILFKQKRLEKGFTQEELANEFLKQLGIKMTRTFVSQIERGERNPKLDDAKEIAKYFNTTVEKLFT